MNINVINRGDNIDILESIMDIPDVDCLVENTPEAIENIALGLSQNIMGNLGIFDYEKNKMVIDMTMECLNKHFS